MKKTLWIAAMALMMLASAPANAELIAYWNCNDQTNLGGTTGLWRLNPLGVPGGELEYANDLGSGTAEISTWGLMDPSEGNLVGTNGTSGSSAANNFGSFSGTTLNAIGADTAGGSLSIVGTDNNNHYFLIEIDNAITNAVLTYATRGTSTGFTTHSYEYSTDNGSTWTSLESHASVQTSTWAVHTVNLGTIFASTWGHENNLIKATVSGATGTTGNNRFDNLQINGDIVPEPATLTLLAFGGLALIRRR